MTRVVPRDAAVKGRTSREEKRRGTRRSDERTDPRQVKRTTLPRQAGDAPKSDSVKDAHNLPLPAEQTDSGKDAHSLPNFRALVDVWFQAGGKAYKPEPGEPPIYPTLMARLKQMHKAGQTLGDLDAGLRELAHRAAHPINLHFYVERARLVREERERVAEHEQRKADEERYTRAIRRQGESAMDAILRDARSRVG